MEFHDLLSCFVRVHILHHAADGEVYGQWLIEELARTDAVHDGLPRTEMSD